MSEQRKTTNKEEPEPSSPDANSATNVSSETSDAEVASLEQLVEEGVVVDGAIAQVGDAEWVIHGDMGYGGEVIMAEFPEADSAQHLLDDLGTEDGK